MKETQTSHSRERWKPGEKKPDVKESMAQNTSCRVTTKRVLGREKGVAGEPRMIRNSRGLQWPWEHPQGTSMGPYTSLMINSARRQHVRQAETETRGRKLERNGLKWQGKTGRSSKKLA